LARRARIDRRLHPNGELFATGNRFSQDGTYLRFKTTTPGVQELNLPNGVKQFFGPDGPTQTIDPFGNWFNVAFGTTTWTITDIHQRTHVVTFGTVSGQKVVTKIELEKFGGGTKAVYLFSYGTRSLPRACNHPQTCTGGDGVCGDISNATVPVLTQVQLPDTSTYQMPLTSYHQDSSVQCHDRLLNGSLEKLILPTGGAFEWDWTTVLFPQESANVQGGVLKGNEPGNPFTLAAGISQRRWINRSGGELGHWDYGRQFTTCPGDTALCELIVTVTNAPPGDSTKHYFSAYPGRPVGSGLTDPAGGWTKYEYGLPFTRKTADGSSPGRYKSTEVFDKNGVKVTTSYVRYELSGTTSKANPRVVSTRTVHHDDAGRRADLDLSDFDGLGHYRHSITGGTFPGDNVRETHTEHNPGKSIADTPNPGEAWVLGTWTTQWTRYGTRTVTREADFDPATGFLRRTRARKGAACGGEDVVVVRTGASGFATKETSYGGYGSSLPCGALKDVSPTGQAIRYEQRHTYQFGSLATSRWWRPNGTSMPFLSVDRTIDRWTGLPSSSRDTASLQTTYTYDAMGRVTQENRPAGHGADTFYTYSLSSGTLPRRVLIQAKDGSTVVSEGEVRLDDFGRVAEERRRMPDGTWSVQTTDWSSRGWVDLDRLQGGRQPDRHGAGRDRAGREQQPGAHEHRHHRELRPVRAPLPGHRAERDPHLVHLRPDGEPDPGEAERPGHTDPDPDLRLRRPGLPDLRDPPRARHRDHLLAARRPGQPGAHPARRVGHDLRLRPRLPADGGQGNHERPGLEELDLGHRQLPGGHLEQRQAAERDAAQPVPYPPSRSTIIEAPVTESYQYNGVGGRISKVTTDVAVGGSPHFEYSLAYDALGNVTSRTYPQCTHSFCSQASVLRTVPQTFTHGSLTSIPGYATAITYHSNGLWKQIDHANGVNDVLAKDPNDMMRPLSISTTGASVNYSSGSFAYDGAGNITKMSTERFVYDSLSRIVDSNLILDQTGNPTAGQNYTYDVFGNLLSMTSERQGQANQMRTIGTNSSTNRMTAAGYDTSGNVVSWAGRAYSYDPFDMVYQTNGFTFVYGPGDERLWTIDWSAGSAVSNWVETWTLRDLDASPLRELRSVGGNNSGAWSLHRDYVHGPAGLLAAVTPQGTRHFHPDHLGSPRIVTNTAKTTLARHEYFPFGEEATSPTQDDHRLKFTGHERDDLDLTGTTGDLDYMHARYFSQQLGRFWSVDPLGGNEVNPQSWNRYAYTLGNPLKYTDPLGEFPWEAVGQIGMGQLQCLINGGCDFIEVTGEDPEGNYDPLTGVSGYLDLVGGSAMMLRLSGASGDGRGYELSISERVLSAIPTGLAQTTGEALVGFGDTVSFGLTGLYRSEAGLSNTIDEESGAYLTGQVAGVAHGVALGGAAAARAGGGYSVIFRRYPRAGGGGMTVEKSGRRVFGIDWHKFKLGGKEVNRPHFHSGATKNQLKKHRPWQGGWGI
jgi:RHS repeat-associated protein